jgi:hypothetical protein
VQIVKFRRFVAAQFFVVVAVISVSAVVIACVAERVLDDILILLRNERYL